ncbi:hypothetical protein FB451DRAFT_485440 [Mycena latifolia]|nr:hypothetical protein FB451DRAFT_485440 [Mycena latifolia]
MHPFPPPIFAQAPPGVAWPSPASSGLGGIALPTSGSQAPAPSTLGAKPTSLRASKTLPDLCPNIALPGSAFQPMSHDPTVPTPSGASAPESPSTVPSPHPPTTQPRRDASKRAPAQSLLQKTLIKVAKEAAPAALFPNPPPQAGEGANKAPRKSRKKKAPQTSPSAVPPVQDEGAPAAAPSSSAAPKSRKRKNCNNSESQVVDQEGVPPPKKRKTFAEKNPGPASEMSTFRVNDPRAKSSAPANQSSSSARPQFISPPAPVDHASGIEYPGGPYQYQQPQEGIPLGMQNTLQFDAPPAPVLDYDPQFAHQPAANAYDQSFPLEQYGMQPTGQFDTQDVPVFDYDAQLVYYLNPNAHEQSQSIPLEAYGMQLGQFDVQTAPTFYYDPQLLHQSDAYQLPQEPLPLVPQGLALPDAQHGPPLNRSYPPVKVPRVLYQVLPDGTLPPADPQAAYQNGRVHLHNLVCGETNTPIPPNPRGRYCITLLTGARLVDAQYKEGRRFYGNELYDPCTHERWVLRVKEILADDPPPETAAEGVPSASAQAPAPTCAPNSSSGAANARVDEIPVPVLFCQADVGPMPPSAVHVPHDQAAYDAFAPTLPAPEAPLEESHTVSSKIDDCQLGNELYNLFHLDSPQL